MAVKIVCDFCDRPLNTEMVDGVEVIKHFYTKECNTRTLFPLNPKMLMVFGNEIKK